MLLVSYIFFCTRKSVKSLFTKKKEIWWDNNTLFIFNVFWNFFESIICTFYSILEHFLLLFFLFSLVLILKRHQSVPLTDWWNHVMQSYLTLTNNHFLVQFLLLDNFIKFFPFQFEYIYFNLLKKCKQLLRYVICGNNLLCNPSDMRDLCLMKWNSLKNMPHFSYSTYIANFEVFQ